MTDPIHNPAPATDEDIKQAASDWSIGSRERFRQIALDRIDADRDTIAAKDAEIRRLEDAIMPEHDLSISFDACCGRERSHEAARAINARRRPQWLNQP